MRYSLLIAIITILSTAACDSAEQSDEIETATRVAITLEDTSSPHTVAWSAERSIGLVDGVAFTDDTLAMTSGTVFIGSLEFFDESGTNITEHIRSEAERYQVFYEVSGLDGMRVRVEDNETDYGSNQFGINLPVGLRLSLTTPTTEIRTTGSLRVKVGYFAPGQKNGYTLTVDPLYDFVIPIRVDPVAPPPEPPAPTYVTTFRWDLIRQDDLKTISLTAGDRFDGLDLDGEQLPLELLDIDVCERDSVDVEFTCTEVEEITVHQNEHYVGRVTVSDRESGESFTEHVRANQEEFRIYFNFQFSPTGLTYDEDAGGLPVGLEIDWRLPTGIQIGGGRLIFRMFAYDREWGGDKAALVPSAKLVDFRIRFNLDR